MDCPLEICSSRDQRGIYKKAKAGLIREFTGVSAPYESPEHLDLIIKSYKEDASEAAERVIKLLEKRQIIQAKRHLISKTR